MKIASNLSITRKCIGGLWHVNRLTRHMSKLLRGHKRDQEDYSGLKKCCVRDISVSDTVRLISGVPTQWLCRGDVGVVKSLWLSPMLACEVEFYPPNQRFGVRALLFPEQFEVIKARPENN